MSPPPSKPPSSQPDPPPHQPQRQAPGAFPFTAQDALEFMQRLWNPLGVPIPGFGLPAATPASGTPPGVAPPVLPFPNPAAMFAALDPAEFDRKIGELRVIEGWLAMSLNMMQMSIKTMELQKASLLALRSAHVPSSNPPSAGTPPRPKS
jgi:hypothetical protein